MSQDTDCCPQQPDYPIEPELERWCMSHEYREHLKTTSNGELDAIALSMFTLRRQVRLNRAQDHQLMDIWHEFCRRDRRGDYMTLDAEAGKAWREGRAPEAHRVTEHE